MRSLRSLGSTNARVMLLLASIMWFESRSFRMSLNCRPYDIVILALLPIMIHNSIKGVSHEPT